MNLLVDIRISMISCPGVRMSLHEIKLYLKIKLFNCLAISSQFKPKFPVIICEHFYFDKQFNCQSNQQLFALLSDEDIVIELIDERNLLICKYQSNACHFLYPKPQLRPMYSQSSRSVLMDSCLLPIGPKLEFKIINTITDSDTYIITNSDSDCNSQTHPESESPDIQLF